jgi:hypothetical protein
MKPERCFLRETALWFFLSARIIAGLDKFDRLLAEIGVQSCESSGFGRPAR